MICLFSTRFIKPPTAHCGVQKDCFFQRKNDIGIYQVHTFGHSKLHMEVMLLISAPCISVARLSGDAFLLTIFFLRGQLSARMMTDVAPMLLGKHRQRGLSFIYYSIYVHGNAQTRTYIWENYYTFQSIEFQCNFATS